MSKLNIDQKTIKALLTDKRSDFLIPDYQRPYAWTEDECATLWDDLKTFAIPENNINLFNDNDEYFLGPIVTFMNEGTKQFEVIDGQQRLTTIMLMLRAFCSRFENMKDEDSVTMHTMLEQCIWKTGSLDRIDKTKLKIDSEVASDECKQEFLDVLNAGEVKSGQNSQYAKNFQYFEKQINDLVNTMPTYVAMFAWRILNNVILLPIEAESQSTALRIFSTLNDRGLPLSDADIFKSQFYKYYADNKEKDSFVRRWKDLEELCNRIFNPMRGTPMDELFTRYMYFERAKLGIKDTTTEALRDFYEKDHYALLKSEQTFANLEALAGFWRDVHDQSDRFSEGIQRQLYVLNYAPNGMWTYLVSVYYMQNRNENDLLDETDFGKFLSLITAFVWAYAVVRPGVNALRTPVYPELINIVKNQPVTFERFKFEREAIKAAFMSYSFNNGRPITRSVLTWWAFNNPQQQMFDLDAKLDIEHIYAKKRAENEGGLSNPKNIESIGNKALLESRINIRASDYRFADKKKYYEGFTTDKGQVKEGTKIAELQQLAKTADDFTENDIEKRAEMIIDAFVDYLGANDLLAE